MDNRKILKQMVISLCVGLVLLAIHVLCGPDCSIGAVEYAGEIKYGVETAYTGPYASASFITTQGAEDFWKQHNYSIEVGGKVYKVPYRVVDYKSDASQSVANFNRFVADKAVIVKTNWTPGMVAMFPLAQKERVPVICNGFSKDVLYPPTKYMYSCSPSYPGILCAGTKWYKENKWKGPGKMKVALLLWDNAFGRASHIDAVYDYLTKDLGVEVLPTEFFPAQVKDFTPNLLRLKNAGVNLIFQQSLHGQYAMLAKDAKRLNMTPEVALMATLWNLSEDFIKLAGDASEEAYGLWQFYLDPADDNPSLPVVQKVRDGMEKYRGNRYHDNLYFAGWMHEYIVYHALEITLKKYGYPITSEQVAECLSTMPIWDWGLSRKFYGYSGGDRLGLHEVRVYQVKKGKIVCYKDWLSEPMEFIKRAPWVFGRESIH